MGILPSFPRLAGVDDEGVVVVVTVGTRLRQPHDDREGAGGQVRTHQLGQECQDPIIYYVKWVVSENVGGFNAGIQNSHYTDGITCPYEIPDQWEYEYQRQWFIDPTLKVRCTKYKK